jgi:hypothetical protein
VSTYLNSARARALRPIATLPRPHLTIVSKTAARAPRVPFVAFVVALMALGLVGLLLLNTSMEKGAYTTGALRARSAALAQQEQELQLQVATLQDPQRLSRRAERLGMVQDNSPSFLVLGSGRIIGKPTPAAAGDAPSIAVAPPGAQRFGRKILPVLAGTHNSATTGVLVVPATPAGSSGHTNAGDTPRRSADHSGGGGTKVATAPTRQ